MKSYVSQAEIAQVWKTSWKVLKSQEKKLKTTLSCSVTKSCYVHSSRYVTTGHNKDSHFFYLSANHYSHIGHILAITVSEVGLLWDTDPCLLDSLSGKAGDPVLIEIS